MNLNNHWKIKQEIENKLRDDIPKHADRIIKGRNLFSWWKIRSNCGSTVLKFFGNEYDNDANCLNLKIDAMNNTSFFGTNFHGTRCYR